MRSIATERCSGCGVRFPLVGSVCVPCKGEMELCAACGGALTGFGADKLGRICFACKTQKEPTLSLGSEMRQVLAEMSLLQYGKTQAFDASGGKSENPDPRPSGESWPLADKWAERWTREPSERTLMAARAELQAVKVRQAPAIDNGSSEDDWVIEDGEGLTPDEAAMRFKRTPAMIRRLRLARDRDSECGLPYDRPSERVPDARERVLNLTSQGCTVRQIEMQTGVKRETVRRWMKEAA